MGECEVLAGMPGYLMQAALGVVSVTALGAKWLLQGSTRRSLNVFIRDASKQLIGWAWIHALNIAFAEYLPAHVGVDQCDWYGFTIAVDTTLGTLLLFLLLRAAQRLLMVTGSQAAKEVAHFGNYKGEGTRVKEGVFLRQLLLWVLLVSLMKVAMVALLRSLPLAFLTLPLGQGIEDHPTVKLFVVMVAVPAVMNTMQYLVVDSFIDIDSNQGPPPPAPEPHPKLEEPLLSTGATCPTSAS